MPVLILNELLAFTLGEAKAGSVMREIATNVTSCGNFSSTDNICTAAMNIRQVQLSLVFSLVVHYNWTLGEHFTLKDKFGI